MHWFYLKQARGRKNISKEFQFCSVRCRPCLIISVRNSVENAPQTRHGEQNAPKQHLRGAFQRGKRSVAVAPVLWEITAARSSAVTPHWVPINHAFEKLMIGIIFAPAVLTVRTSPSGVWSSCQKRQAFGPHAFTFNLMLHGNVGSSGSFTSG